MLVFNGYYSFSNKGFCSIRAIYPTLCAVMRRGVTDVKRGRAIRRRRGWFLVGFSLRFGV